MALEWREHPEAQAELWDAYDYYASQGNHGLDIAFIDAVEATVALIRHWPGSGAPLNGRDRSPEMRKRRIGKFPLSVVYVFDRETLLVLAYAHEKRRPGYWSSRFPGVDE